jgi:hypothetical protein
MTESEPLNLCSCRIRSLSHPNGPQNKHSSFISQRTISMPIFGVVILEVSKTLMCRRPAPLLHDIGPGRVSGWDCWCLLSNLPPGRHIAQQCFVLGSDRASPPCSTMQGIVLCRELHLRYRERVRLILRAESVVAGCF